MGPIADLSARARQVRAWLTREDAGGRVRIESDGTVKGTRVLYPDGSPIPRVQRVEWSIEVGGRARARIEILDVDVRLESEVDG